MPQAPPYLRPRPARGSASLPRLRGAERARKSVAARQVGCKSVCGSDQVGSVPPPLPASRSSELASPPGIQVGKGAGQGGSARFGGGEGSGERCEPGSRPASAPRRLGAGTSPAPEEGQPLLASSEAQEGGGGGGGEGVKVKGSEAAARPWAAASAGCFDHGGAVAVSFCSRGSSRAAGRPPWGPALPRPTPRGPHREGGRRARPSSLQAPPDAPSSPLCKPPGPRPAVGEGGAGRPQLPPRLAARPGGWGRCQGVLGTPAPPPLLSAAHPARPPDSLTHPTHAHSWPEAMLRSGGRARRATGTHYRGRVARPPPPRPCTRGAHARAPHTHVRLAPEHAT